MKTQLPDAPILLVETVHGHIEVNNRWDAGYYDHAFHENEKRLTELGAVPLGQFIPDELPDGSKGITYGQVGVRHLSPRGAVRYLQVINIRDTGIDFAVKPDRVAAGSHNDPPRSRVLKGDILLSNTAFRGTKTLIGRCVVVHRDYGKLNISQDIDRIRVVGVNPYYVGAFLKSKLGQSQVQRLVHGVDSQKFNFGHIRSFRLPILRDELQKVVEQQYMAMAKAHDQAMALKERILNEANIDPGRNGEAINALAKQNAGYRRAMTEAQDRLQHLIGELEAFLQGVLNTIRPFPT
jgi:hypothetical protein